MVVRLRRLFSPTLTFELRSPLPPDEAENQLRRHVDSRKWLGPFASAPFRGDVGRDFKIVRVLRWYANSWQAVYVGTIEAAGDGSRIRVTARLNRSVAAFAAVWLSGVAAFGIAGLVIALVHHNPLGLAFSGVACAFSAYLAALTQLLFRFDVKRGRRDLVDILGGVAAVSAS